MTRPDTVENFLRKKRERKANYPIAITLSEEEAGALIDFHENMIRDAEEDGTPGWKSETVARKERIKVIKQAARS